MIPGLGGPCEAGSGVFLGGGNCSKGGGFICRLLNLFCPLPWGKGSGENPNAALPTTGPHVAIESPYILSFSPLRY